MTLPDLCNDARCYESFATGYKRAHLPILGYTPETARYWIDNVMHDPRNGPELIAYYAGIAAAHGIDLSQIPMPAKENDR